MQKVRGTQDWFEKESFYFRSMEEQFFKKALAYGFGEIKTPLFEHSEVFHRTLGESSDVIAKETYTFNDRSNESLTLRPEGTAGIARSFISEGLAQKIPLKFYYCGPMFRYERPQKGRFRQFHQMGIEVLGIDSPSMDIECLQLGYDLLKIIGVEQKCVLKLNTLGDPESRAAYKEKLVSYYSQFKQDLSKDSQIRLVKNPLRILDSKDEKDIEINEMAPKLLESLNESSKKYFDTLIALLEKVNLAYQIDNSLVRGLDYYGHTVFEFVTQELGAQGTVLAGGRYDGLISLMGGPKTPGVGWAAGVERLTDLANKELLSEKRTLISLIAADETGEPEVLKLAARIRNFETHTFSTHIKLTTEIIYGGNVGKKMKKAAGKNTDFALVIGSTEIENKILAVKNMKTGESFQIPFEMDSLMKVLGSN